MTLKELFTTNMKWNADSWILVNDILGNMLFNGEAQDYIIRYGSYEVLYFCDNEITLKLKGGVAKCITNNWY